jgi:hypothetical protein
MTYWPQSATDPQLWNPRQEGSEVHFLTLADGTLYPLTRTGEFTLRRLRLNRPPLVAYRRQQQTRTEETRLLTQCKNLLALLEQLRQQQAALLEEHRSLLEEQKALLKLMLRNKE